MNDCDASQIREAHQILESNLYITLSTASLEGTPWVSPVYFAYDGDLNIYWCSDVDSRHSNYIVENPQVAAVIFDSSVPEGTGTGLYLFGEAPGVRGVLRSRSHPAPEFTSRETNS